MKTSDRIKKILARTGVTPLLPNQKVRVYPHGSPQLAAVGRIEFVSVTQLSIIVEFPEIPPFAYGPFSPVHVVFVATRHTLDDVPWGPWIESNGYGHFEIEPAPEEPSK